MGHGLRSHRGGVDVSIDVNFDVNIKGEGAPASGGPLRFVGRAAGSGHVVGGGRR